MRAAAVTALLLITSCSAYRAPEQRFSEPTPAFVETWQQRAVSTGSIGYLAAASFATADRDESFTLEMFFRSPDTYILRGRGTLGVTGFRAKLIGDSLTFLLNREGRGYAGRVGDYPDSSLVEMWKLMSEALPWVFGTADLESSAHWRVRLTNRGTRPEYVEVTDPPYRLGLTYGRYRSGYPYWHLRSVAASATDGNLALEFRQWLHNTDLPDAIFELTLPPGTRPLND